MVPPRRLELVGLFLLGLGNVNCESNLTEQPEGILISGPERVRNGDRIVLKLDLHAEAHVSADFASVDSNYDASRVTVTDAGGGVYEITYTLSGSNQKPDGTYVLGIDVRIGGEEGFVVRETYPIELINTIPRAGKLSLGSGGRNLGASGVLLAFTIELNTAAELGGVRINLSGLGDAVATSLGTVVLYRDVDGDGVASAADERLAEGRLASGESGSRSVRFSIGGGEGGRIPLPQGTSGFVIAFSANCASSLLAGAEVSVELPVGGLHLLAANEGKLDLEGLPLRVVLKGEGPFERLWSTDLGVYPSGGVSAAATDLNLDGREEILVTSGESRFLWSLKSATLTSLSVADARKDLEASLTQSVFLDIDSDGIKDAIGVAEHSKGPITALSSAVDAEGRNFAARTHEIFSQPRSFVIARDWTDVTSDGVYDTVLLGERTGSIITATGAFRDKTFSLTLLKEIKTGLSGIVGIAAFDYDKDKSSDIAIATTSLSEGVIYLYRSANKDGDYKEAYREAGLLPISMIRASDLNADVLPEVLAVSRDRGELRILEVAPEGVLTAVGIVKDLDSPESVETGDLDGNGTDDLVIVEKSGAQVRAVYLASDFSIEKSETLDLNSSTSGQLTAADGVILADLDGNGSREIVAMSETRMAVLRRTAGSFGLAFVTPAQSDITGIALQREKGRVTRVIASDAANDKVYVYALGRQGNLLGVSQTVDTDSAGVALASAPLTGGSSEDLAALLSGGSIGIFGDGGNLTARASITTTAGGVGLALHDFDANGRLDLAHATPVDGTISWFLNSGGGVFAPSSITTLPDPEGIVIADVSGDGRGDLIGFHPLVGSLSVAVFDSDADGFGVAAEVPLGAVPSSAVSADTDGDGVPEVIVGTETGELILFQPTGGTPPLASLRNLAVGETVAAISASDVDGDGRPDLLATGRDGLSFIKSLGGGSYCARAVTQTASGPSLMKLGDLDGDGGPDVVIVGKGDRVIEAYRTTLKD